MWRNASSIADSPEVGFEEISREARLGAACSLEQLYFLRKDAPDAPNPSSVQPSRGGPAVPLGKNCSLSAPNIQGSASLSLRPIIPFHGQQRSGASA